MVFEEFAKAVKRLQYTILWRFATVALIFALAGVAATGPARSSGTAVAVTTFENHAGSSISQRDLDQLGTSLYQAVRASNRFTAVGGGPLNVKTQYGADRLQGAVDAASRASAEEVVIGDVLSASGGNVVYRLSAYRVAPLGFIRSQVFSQSSLSSQALVSGFGTNLATLNAPRTAVGTIYSLVNGVHADLGEAAGFKLGQLFNVMRYGQKMADARIEQITSNDATLAITNPVRGYTPVVGDRVVATEPQPALGPAMRTSNSFNPIAFLVLAGGVLLAIGHHGQESGFNARPTPTPSGAGAFSIIGFNQTGVAPNETFTFNFSQAVNTAQINFSTTDSVSYSSTNPTVPRSPVTNLGGPVPTWDATNKVLTIITANVLVGQVITFHFSTPLRPIVDLFGDPLALTDITFTARFDRQAGAMSHGPGPAQPQPGGVPNPVPPQGVIPPKPHEPKDPHSPHNPK